MIMIAERPDLEWWEWTIIISVSLVGVIAVIACLLIRVQVIDQMVRWIE